MARVCRIVLVTEGWEDSAFLKGFFESAGMGRSITTKENPRSEGSGFSFVREIFVDEVYALGRFNEGRGVLALMDEDGQGVENRVSWVADLLASRELPAADCANGRCLLLPKRNLETWVFWLTGARQSQNRNVTETDNYKHCNPVLVSSDWRAAGSHLHSLNHTTPPNGMPPELIIALGKLRQFAQAVRR